MITQLLYRIMLEMLAVGLSTHLCYILSWNGIRRFVDSFPIFPKTIYKESIVQGWILWNKRSASIRSLPEICFNLNSFRIKLVFTTESKPIVFGGCHSEFHSNLSWIREIPQTSRKIYLVVVRFLPKSHTLSSKRNARRMEFSLK